MHPAASIMGATSPRPSWIRHAFAVVPPISKAIMSVAPLAAEQRSPCPHRPARTRGTGWETTPPLDAAEPAGGLHQVESAAEALLAEGRHQPLDVPSISGCT